jgi:hypothetical protein
MGKRSILAAVILLLVFGGIAPATQDAKNSEKTDKDKCLACHGPFEKIAKATESWEAPSGEKTTPHRYVAHDTKDIPECTECHVPHPIPLQDKSTLVKSRGVEFCYSGCHHARNLQPCKSCH